MSANARWIWLIFCFVFISPAMAQHHHGSMVMRAPLHDRDNHNGPWHPGPNPVPAPSPVIGGGFGGGFLGGGFYGGGIAGGGFFGGNNLFVPQPAVIGVPVFVPMAVPVTFAAGGGGQGGLRLPMPSQALQIAHAENGGAVVTRTRRASPTRARELVLIAARSFRANDVHRAAERLQLAIKADPASPMPHLHMVQVSIVRGDYQAAAESLRMAVTVAKNREWLSNAPDIQAIYSEPADFAKQLAKLESHLQVHPNDRDAWFVLGAQWYFSGRTQQAADVFQRLTDRRPDEALAAFLDAATPTR